MLALCYGSETGVVSMDDVLILSPTHTREHIIIISCSVLDFAAPDGLLDGGGDRHP